MVKLLLQRNLPELTRDYLVIVGFGLVALVLTSTSVLYTSIPPWANLGMLAIVGVVIPQLINKFLDSNAVGTSE